MRAPIGRDNMRAANNRQQAADSSAACANSVRAFACGAGARKLATRRRRTSRARARRAQVSAIERNIAPLDAPLMFSCAALDGALPSVVGDNLRQSSCC